MLEKFKISFKKYWYAYVLLGFIYVIRIFNYKPLSYYKHLTFEYKIHSFSLWVGFWIFSTLCIFAAIISFKRNKTLTWIMSFALIITAIKYFILPINSYILINKNDKDLAVYQQKIDSIRNVKK